MRSYPPSSQRKVKAPQPRPGCEGPSACPSSIYASCQNVGNDSCAGTDVTEGCRRAAKDLLDERQVQVGEPRASARRVAHEVDVGVLLEDAAPAAEKDDGQVEPVVVA